MLRCWLATLALVIASAPVASAHIGSPDIYLDGNAGPYRLLVTIRTPVVIPGVAELQVRSATGGVTAMHAVPLPMSGPGAKFAPVPDKLTASAQDPQLFSGALWMMVPGSWQVRVTVEGSAGAASLSIPVPAAALRTKRMQSGLGTVLLVLGMFLVSGAVAMAGASVREARLDPGVTPNAKRVRAGRIAMGVATFVIAAALWGGNRWWNSEAVSYAADVYKPLQMRAALSPSETLTLNLTDPGWLNGAGWRTLFKRSVDDFIPDHNHLMHLYAIRRPGLDVVYHLHPELTNPGVFEMKLPSMAAGDYTLYADVVHANGFPETLVAKLALPQPVSGRPLGTDEAAGSASPWQTSAANARSFQLPDAYRMVWLTGGQNKWRAKQPVLFRFRLEKPDGARPDDMAFYMGMPGHAAFVKTDGAVFAHVHPAGSVSMAALMLAQQQNDAKANTPTQTMEGMSMPPAKLDSAASGLPDEVTFPYGFPTPGRYRIFVQMKHGSTVETGIFDASVT